MHPLSSVPLLEREADVEALELALAAAARGRGRLVLVEGPAGAGKSRLLAEARRRADEGGFGPLAARGGEFERGVPFGVARELFAPALRAAAPADQPAVFRGAAELAMPLFAGAASAAEEEAEPPSSFPVAHGLYWLLANLAEPTPRLVTVDDAQWADPASLRFLLYLAQRLEGLAVTLVVALRPEDAPAAGPELARLRALPEARVLQLAPLSADATATLTRRYFPDADPEFCRAVFETSGGNPFLVRELLATLDLDAVPPTAAGAARARRTAPESVVRATTVRIAQLPPEAAAVAEAAAVLDADAHLHRVVRLARLDPVTAAAAAGDLVRAGILRAGDPLRFAQPPVWSAVRDQIPPDRRGALHATAAAVLEEEAAPLERIAPHLLAASATGDARVVALLRSAADRAAAVGAPETAVRYLRRALAEPPPTAERAELLVELGRLGAAIGDPEAVQHLSRAVPLLPDRPARAGALYEVGRALVHAGRYEEAVDTLRRGLDEAGSGRSEVRRRLLAALLQSTRLVPGSREIDLLAQAAAAAEDEIDEPGLGALLGELSYEQLLAGEPAGEVVSTAESALAEFDQPAYGPDGLPFYDAVAALTWADNLDAAKAALDQALAHAERHGQLMAVATACFRRAMVSYLQGSIAAAVTDAQRAVDAGAHGWATYLPVARAVLALALVEQRELARAAAILEPDGPSAPSDTAWQNLALLPFARATLHLAQDSPAEAQADALTAGRIMTEELGSANPAIIPWRSLAAVAAHRLGDAEAAHRLAAEEVALAREFGAARSLGMALRVQGVVHGGRTGLALLGEAIDVLSDSPARLELARALADLGEALARAGRAADAEPVLRRGLDVAQRCGATLLTDRLHATLRATGARVRRRRRTDPTTLTPTEDRVARLVAGGLTNKDVAQQLFVSVRAVEFHLGNVYAKLGIASRRQLRGALAALPQEETD